MGIQDNATSPIVWDAERLIEVHSALTIVTFNGAVAGNAGDLGKIAVYRTRFVTNTGKKGPLSDNLSALIN